MSTRPDAILAFFAPSARRDNDATNKLREDILELLLSKSAAAELCELEGDPSHGLQWRQLRQALLDAVNELVNREPQLLGAQLVAGLRKSGRNYNYDFDFVFRGRDGKERTLRIELKKGRSIHDQPQFLSLPAKRGNVTGNATVSYPEFFYDNYSARLCAIAPSNPPDRDTYLKLVGRVEYECHPFFQAHYDDDALGTAGSAARGQIADQSAHEYLCLIQSLGRPAIAWDALGEKLAQQHGKYFLSWHAGSCSFTIETYSKDDLQLSGEVGFGRGDGELYRYLLLPVVSGHELACMLRWRNHKAVLNPAWQIRLKQNAARK